jgi:hypothetical protein
MFDYTKKITDINRQFLLFFPSLLVVENLQNHSFLFPPTFWGKKRADLDRVKSTMEILAMTYLQLTSSIPTIHTIPLCYLYTFIRYKENFHTKPLTITPGLKFTSSIGLVYWTFEHVPEWSWYCLFFFLSFFFP